MDRMAHQDAFERVAADYRASRSDYPEAMVDWLADQVGRPGVVADLGCGPGLLTRPLARRFPAVVGLDFAIAMLRAMRSEADLPAVQGAGERLPLATGSIGLVVCSQSLHWMQIDAVLAEIHRVLRPAGWMLLCWQGWMAADAAAEALFEEGRRAVLGAGAVRDPGRPRMHEVADRLAGAGAARYEAVYEVPFTPERLARLFASRASIGRLERRRREALERWWTEHARARLGPFFRYGFRVQARLFRAPGRAAPTVAS